MEGMSIWTNDDPRLHLVNWDSDEGPPLLLTHGMSGSTLWWENAASSLCEHFRPTALDFRGHGDSDWREDGNYDMSGFVEDLEQARHAIGVPRLVLCGHSNGARVAIEYALKYPERVIALVAVDFLCSGFERSKFATMGRAQPTYSDAAALAERFRLHPAETKLSPDELKALGRRSTKKSGARFTWKFDWRALGLSTGEVWPALAKLKMPTLFVRGEGSTVMSHADLERAAKTTPGCKTVELKGAYHHVPLDSPKELAGEIARFVGCLSSAA